MDKLMLTPIPFRTVSLVVALATVHIAGMIPIGVGDETPAGPVTPEGRVISEHDGWTHHAMEPARLVETHRTIFPALWTVDDATRSFFPADHLTVDDNAAVWYLQASGFFEQQAAQERLNRFYAEQSKRMDADRAYYPAPYRWLDVAPDAIPIRDVRDYVSIFSFQNTLLQRAERCRRFDLQRNARRTGDPINYLLPETQAFRRSIVQTQRLRTRLALAEGRIDDATRRAGQNLRFAHHLSHDPFLVVTAIAENLAEQTITDLLHLVSHRDCPNLYDAFTRLPDPLLVKSDADDFENELLFYQVPQLRQIESDSASSIDWPSFIDQVLPQFGDCKLKKAHRADGRLSAGLFIASADGEVTSYLIGQQLFTRSELEAMSPLHRFFLAAIQLRQQLQIQQLRTQNVPPATARKQVQENQLLASNHPILFDTVKWSLAHSGNQTMYPQQRTKQLLAVLQTIEALRDHLARHGGFPSNLDEMWLPAPADPMTGQPLGYAKRSGDAVLTTGDNGFERRQVVLKAGAITPADTPRWVKADDIASQGQAARIIARYSVPSGDVARQTYQTPWWTALNDADRERLRASLGRLFADDDNADGSPISKTVAMNVDGQAEAVDRLNAEEQRALAEAESAAPGAAGETGVRAAIAIPSVVRHSIAAAVGGGTATETASAIGVVFGSARWITLDADVSAPSIEIVVQCESDTAASDVQPHLIPSIIDTYQQLTGLPRSEALEQSNGLLTSEAVGDQVRLRGDLSERGGEGATAALAIVASLLRNHDDAEVTSRLRSLMLAIHNYHSAFRAVPPNRIDDSSKIHQGLSWRVAILPFLDKGKYIELYRRFDLSQPWDSPTNKPLVAEIPKIFQPIAHDVLSAQIEAGQTTFQSPSGEGTPMGAGGAKSFRQVIDGLTYTIFIVEVQPDRAVPWTAPHDYVYPFENPTSGLAIVDGDARVAFGDGWAGRLPVQQAEGNWKGMFTRDGVEPIGGAVKQLRE
jgi:hypothetical protein